LDVLVNNAGVGGPTTPVEEYPRETWAAVLAVGGRRRTPRSA